MAIIKHGLNKDESRIISFPSGEPAQIPTIESDQIPFVVATELVPFAQSVSDQEVVAIAVALYKMLPKDEENKSIWGIQGKVESIAKRF